MYSMETETYIANEFSALRDVCYLDHAATTLYAESQIASVFNELNKNVFGNPHSLNLSSRHTTDVIDQVRYRILKHFHTDSDEYSVIFTSGATAALKLVAECFDWKGENFKDDSSNQKKIPSQENTSKECTFSSNVNCTLKASVIKDHMDGKSGSFMYLQDNHTSVLGMRELAAEKGACVHYLSHEDAFSKFGRRDVPTIFSKSAHTTNSLFVYPAQCNFSGVKYPLGWVHRVQSGFLNCPNTNCCHNSRWFCFLDAASFISTNNLDLSAVKPDFVCVSFYKIFGYPTGIGALLVRNSSAHTLRKTYFGGGTVMISLSTEKFHVLRASLSDQFEDGTLPFLSIIALHHGFDTLHRLTGGMMNITLHTLFLSRYVHHSLLLMHHSNGAPAAVLYCDTDYEDFYTQGNIVNFNILRANGEFVGFAEVLQMANLHGIQLRTGCFCNPGACQRHLKLSVSDLQSHFQAGHVCGDEMDLVNGYPTGSIRISFGYMSTKHDADKFLNMITSCFVEAPLIRKVPNWWPSFRRKYREKFGLKCLKSSIGEDLELQNSYKCHSGNNNLTALGALHSLSSDAKINDNLHVKESTDDSNDLLLSKLEGLSVAEEGNQTDLDVQNSVKSELRLKHIYIYPVKSCGAVSVNKWEVSSKGLLYDREWMIVTPSGVCLTQKQETKLCLILPKIDLNLQSLILNCEGFAPVSVPIGQLSGKAYADKAVSLCQSKVCGDRVQGWDCGDEVAEWLNIVLDREGLRLLRQWDSSPRSRKTKVHPSDRHLDTPLAELSLSNQSQFLLVNMASIDWLACELQDSFSTENLLSRFRCNLAVTGSTAFEETEWAELEIANVHLSVDGPCTRCQMICIDQHSGQRTKEPLRTLAASFHGKMRFGIYLRHHLLGDASALLSVNDHVSVLH